MAQPSPIERVSKEEAGILREMAKDKRITDAVVVDQLIESGGMDAGWVQERRAGGTTNKELLHYALTGKGYRRPPNTLQTARQATTSSITNLLGGPADIGAGVLNVIGTGAEMTFPQLGDVPKVDPGPLGSKALRQKVETAYPGSTYESVSDLAPGDRPVALLFENVGTTAALGLAVSGTAKGLRALNLVRPGSYLDDIGKYTKRFLTEESLSGLGAGSAASIAEYAGATPGWRTAFELAGAVVAPWTLVKHVSKKTFSGLNDILVSYTGKGGVESVVAQRLQKVIKENDGDPVKLANALERMRVTRKGKDVYRQGVNAKGELVSIITPAQLTNDPVLRGFEEEISRMSVKFDAKRVEKGLASLRALRLVADEMSDSGMPGLMVEAGKLRMQAYEGYFNLLFANDQAKIADIVSTLGHRGNSLLASRRVKSTLMHVMASGRQKEKKMWSRVDYNTNVRGDNTILGIKKYDAETADLALRIPDVDAFKKAHAGDFSKNSISVRRLQALRSNVLQSARDKTLTPNARRLHYEMADSIWKDIETVETAAGRDARNFTKAFESKFGETFAEEATKASGDIPHITPEKLLDNTFRKGDPNSIQRLNDLESAAGFGGFRIDRQVEAYLSDRISRDVVDEATDRVDAKKLSKWLADPSNNEIFSNYPGLKNSLRDAASVENHLRAVERLKKSSDYSLKKATFAQAAGATDVTALVEKSLRPTVSQGMREVGLGVTLPYERLVRLAKTHGKGATDGLKYASIDVAMRKATTASGDFSWKKFNESITGSIPESKGGFLELMQRHGVMSKAEGRRWNAIIEEGVRVETVLSTRAVPLTDTGSAFKIEPGLGPDFFIRAGGANIATKLPIMSSVGGSLIVAQEGAKLASELFKNTPGTKIKEIAIKAAEDPAFMALLLRKGTPEKYVENVRKAHLALIQAGITAPSELESQGVSIPRMPETQTLPSIEATVP